MSSEEEIKEKIRREYRKLIERWESGGLFYHTKYFMKQYSKNGWIRKDIKDNICGILALARKRVPITVPIFAWFMEISRGHARTHLVHMSSYKILVPDEPIKVRSGVYNERTGTTRKWTLSPEFIKYIYTKLDELEKEKK